MHVSYRSPAHIARNLGGRPSANRDSPRIRPQIIAIVTKVSTIQEVSKVVMERLMTRWNVWYEGIQRHPEFLNRFTGFLLYPEVVTMFWGKTHLAIEYSGPERLTELHQKRTAVLKSFDLARDDKDLFEEIIGFRYISTAQLPLPVTGDISDLILPTDAGHQKLIELV